MSQINTVTRTTISAIAYIVILYNQWLAAANNVFLHWSRLNNKKDWAHLIIFIWCERILNVNRAFELILNINKFTCAQINQNYSIVCCCHIEKSSTICYSDENQGDGDQDGERMSPMFGACAAVRSAWHWLSCGPVRPRHWHGARRMTPELPCWCTTREARRRVVAQSPSLAWSVVTRDDVIPLCSLQCLCNSRAGWNWNRKRSVTFSPAHSSGAGQWHTWCQQARSPGWTAVCYSGEWLTPLPRRRSLADCHRGVTPDAAVELWRHNINKLGARLTRLAHSVDAELASACPSSSSRWRDHTLEKLMLHSSIHNASSCTTSCRVVWPVF